jgi:hypothetical protein
MSVKDGPSCPGCGLPNYEGLCPVCRGDEAATSREGLPFQWPEPCSCEGCVAEADDTGLRRKEPS